MRRAAVTTVYGQGVAVGIGRGEDAVGAGPCPSVVADRLARRDGRVVDAADRDRDGGDVRVEVAVVGPVGEAVGAVVVRRGRVGEASRRRASASVPWPGRDDQRPSAGRRRRRCRWPARRAPRPSAACLRRSCRCRRRPTGASLTGVTVIVTVATLRVDGAVVGLEGEAVGAVVVRRRRVGEGAGARASACRAPGRVTMA